MENQNSEIRKFKMHPDLLYSVIKSQAGTEEKAVLEAVMNAVDAGASKCEIVIDENGYIIKDDGKGFVSKKEVDEFFETFGTPHKEGDATYGRFRMGRGQLFAFSSTVWKTTTFEMHVDIKKTGLDYVLKENLPSVTGCSIEGKWYKKMATQELYKMTKELEQLIKYMQIPVYVNGKNLSIDPNKQKWDYKEEDFYIKVNKNDTKLTVYNMGALVSDYSANKFGVGGVIVTKSALKVNFARNDVLVSECQLWKKIAKKMKEVMGVETAKRNVLNDFERHAIVESLLTKETNLGKVLDKGLLLDVSGKRVSIDTVLRSKRITFSTGNYVTKKLEERVNDNKMALVLHENTLNKFNVSSGKEFIKKINELVTESDKNLEKEAQQYNRVNWTKYHEITKDLIHMKCNADCIDINDLIKNIKNTYDILEDKSLTKKEQIFLKAIKAINVSIGRMVYYQNNNEKSSWEEAEKYIRTITIGKSEIANAWTDGLSYICIEHKNLNKSPMQIIHLLIHEYCHNSITNESHDHGSEFYQSYHDVINKNSDQIFSLGLLFQDTYNKLMLKEGMKPKKEYDENIKINEKSEEIKKTFGVKNG